MKTTSDSRGLSLDTYAAALVGAGLLLLHIRTFHGSNGGAAVLEAMSSFDDACLFQQQANHNNHFYIEAVGTAGPLEFTTFLAWGFSSRNIRISQSINRRKDACHAMHLHTRHLHTMDVENVRKIRANH